jgi:streptomycin 6-kinase
MFDPWLARWRLVPDGEPIVTHSSRLLPVRRGREPAMLKIALEEEERWGGLLMVWWAGEGAARVLAHDGDALLLERAGGPASLAALARSGPEGDDEASQIICAAASRLHATAGRPPPPPLIPLDRWFAELGPAAERHGGVLRLAAAAARELLAEPRQVVPLHGDLHHGNVLDGGPRGWLAIDPKRLLGERAFDLANVFCNPDLETATGSGRLARQASVVAAAAGLERERVLRWVLAYAGLSAAWTLGDGGHPDVALAVAEIAAAELGDGTARGEPPG